MVSLKNWSAKCEIYQERVLCDIMVMGTDRLVPMTTVPPEVSMLIRAVLTGIGVILLAIGIAFAINGYSDLFIQLLTR